MKQLEVQIMQQSYLLGCPEGREARLLDAVERVDTAMTRIRDAGKVRARERIAVLAALNLAFELADREAAELAAAAHIPPCRRQPPWAPPVPMRQCPPRARSACRRWCSASTMCWAATGTCSEHPLWPSQTSYNGSVCSAAGFNFLEPMLLEPGLGTLPDERDRLASDEPNVRLPSPP